MATIEKKLTDLEHTVLQALYKSSAGNGHDFGFTDDARDCVTSPRQLAGIVASLVKKGFIRVHDTTTTDSGAWTQFTLRDEPIRGESWREWYDRQPYNK